MEKLKKISFEELENLTGRPLDRVILNDSVIGREWKIVNSSEPYIYHPLDGCRIIVYGTYIGRGFLWLDFTKPSEDPTGKQNYTPFKVFAKVEIDLQ